MTNAVEDGSLQAILTAQKELRRRRIRAGEARVVQCHWCGETTGVYALRNAAGMEILCNEWGAMHAESCPALKRKVSGGRH